MLGACFVGSTLTEPLPQFLAMVNTRQGETVRSALNGRWIISAVPSAAQMTKDQVFNEWIISPSTPQSYKDLYAKGGYTVAQWHSLKMFVDYAANRVRGQSSTPAQLTDRIIAVYLMNSQSNWEGRPDIDIDLDCLDSTVRQMAPLSTFVGSESGFNWWWAALGGVILVGGAAVLIMRKRRKKGVA